MHKSLTTCACIDSAGSLGRLSLSLCFSLMIIIGLSLAKVNQAWAGGEINMLTKGGCKADDKTDNLPMINKALLAGYSILYFPKGTYLVSGQINLVKQSILGDGPAKTVFHQKSATAPPQKNGVTAAVIGTSGTCSITGVTLESEQTDLATLGEAQTVGGINAINNSVSVKNVKFKNYVVTPQDTNELIYGLYLNNASNVTVTGCDFESGLMALIEVQGGKNINVSGSVLNGGSAIVVMPKQAGGTVADVNIDSNTINGQVACAGLLDSKINSNAFGVNGLLQVIGDTFDNKQVIYPGGWGYPGPVNTLQIESNTFATSIINAGLGNAGILWLGAVSGSLPAVQNVQVINNTLVAQASDLKNLYSLYRNLSTGSGIAVTGIDMYGGTSPQSVPTGASRAVKNIVIQGNKISNMISHGMVFDFNGAVTAYKNSIDHCRAEGICVGPDTTGTVTISTNTITDTGFDASLPEKQLNYAVVDVQAIGIGKFTGNKDTTTLPNSIASALKAGHTTKVVPTVLDNIYKGPANNNLFGYRNTP